MDIEAQTQLARRLQHDAETPLEGECINCHQTTVVYKRPIADDTGVWTGLVCEPCWLDN